MSKKECNNRLYLKHFILAWGVKGQILLDTLLYIRVPLKEANFYHFYDYQLLKQDFVPSYYITLYYFLLSLPMAKQTFVCTQLKLQVTVKTYPRAHSVYNCPPAFWGGGGGGGGPPGRPGRGGGGAGGAREQGGE
jgi:hypothetical protein